MLEIFIRDHLSLRSQICNCFGKIHRIPKNVRPPGGANRRAGKCNRNRQTWEDNTMPVVTFNVESYNVITTQSGTITSGAWRNLSLTSNDLGHGIRHRASVFFFEAPSTTA